MKKVCQSGDRRISITVHVQPRQAERLDAAAARACITRHDLARARILGDTVDDAPVLACLARLIAIHNRLDRVGLLDAALRAEIVATVRELTIAVRGEVA